jgi:hypothetical protein
MGEMYISRRAEFGGLGRIAIWRDLEPARVADPLYHQTFLVALVGLVLQ